MHKVIYRTRMHNWNMQKHHIPTLQHIFWTHFHLVACVPTKIHRDLLTLMGNYLHPLVQPEGDCVKIPFQILKGEHTGTENLHHYYLAPHKLMSFMYNNVKTSVQDTILGHDGAME